MRNKSAYHVMESFAESAEARRSKEKASKLAQERPAENGSGTKG